MSNNKKKKASAPAQPSARTPPPTPVAPPTWHASLPVDSNGLNPGPRKLALPPITIRRSKPGTFSQSTFKEIDSPALKQHGLSSFEFPGASSPMKSIVSDPRLSDLTVATVAANKIQGALLSKMARDAKKALVTETKKKDPSIDTKPLEAKLSQRIDRVRSHTEGSANFMAHVRTERDSSAQLASQQSDFLMSKGKKLYTSKVKELSQMKPGNMKVAVAEDFEKRYKSATFTKTEQEFIERMEKLAPEMRASMYFNAADQDKMLGSGALFAKETRKNLGMGTESKTTDSDAKHLGNHDHVFFFLEHQDAKMRKTRFTEESTASGVVHQEHDSESTAVPGARRISLPLSAVMQEGTWAMKHDFLSPELPKEYGPHENMVATSERDPAKATTHFMRQMAYSALDVTKNNKDKRAELLKKGIDGAYTTNNHDFARTVFGDFLRPQLMVPSVVPFNVKGARLDMPTADLEKRNDNSHTQHSQ